MREDSRTVYVSAAEGIGLDTLLARIDALIEEDRVSRVRLSVPQKEGKTLAMLEAKARIFSRKYQDGTVLLEVEAPESVVRAVREFVTRDVDSENRNERSNETAQHRSTGSRRKSRI
jgi:50S ribosomal subunit-associated GTPase HflX